MFRNTSISTTMLNKINLKYHNLIKNNQLLEENARELVSCLFLYPSSNAKNCNKVIDHLIAEVKEEVSDEQRIADESPVGVDECSDSCLQLQQYLNLKLEMEDFYVEYLATDI